MYAVRGIVPRDMLLSVCGWGVSFAVLLSSGLYIYIFCIIIIIIIIIVIIIIIIIIVIIILRWGIERGRKGLGILYYDFTYNFLVIFHFSYYTQTTSLSGYKNAMNDLYIVPERSLAGKTLVCEATKSRRETERVLLTLNVTACVSKCDPKCK